MAGSLGRGYDSSGQPDASPWLSTRGRVVSPLMDGPFSGLSPRRRALMLGVALLVLALVVAVGVTVLAHHVGRRGVPAADRPGPVLLVPGYGGNVGSLDPLATR